MSTTLATKQMQDINKHYIESIGHQFNVDKLPTSGSLNAGYELDDEPIIPNTVELIPVEICEDKIDIEIEKKELLSLESSINDLFYLFQDIKNTTGMSQKFALEAERIAPGTIKVPIGYFTKEPTLTQYKISLEEISKSIWAMIVAGITAIITIIVKIYNWFKNKDDKSLVEKQKEIVKETKEAIEEAKKEDHKTNELLLKYSHLEFKNYNDEVFHCRSIQDVINNMFSKDYRHGKELAILNESNPIVNDILHKGEYTKTILAIIKQIRNSVGLIHQRAAILIKVLKRDAEFSNNLTELAIIRKETALAKNSLNYVISGEKHSLKEIPELLERLRTAALSNTGNKPITYDDLYATFNTMFFNFESEDATVELEYCVHYLNKIEKTDFKYIKDKAENFSLDGSPNGLTETVGPIVRDAVYSINDELCAVLSAIHHIRRFINDHNKIYISMLGIYFEVYCKIYDALKHKPEQVPEDVIETKEIRRIRREKVIRI